MLMALAAMPRTLLQLQSLLRLHTFPRAPFEPFQAQPDHVLPERWQHASSMRVGLVGTPQASEDSSMAVRSCRGFIVFIFWHVWSSV